LTLVSTESKLPEPIVKHFVTDTWALGVHVSCLGKSSLLVCRLSNEAHKNHVN